ncbi:hypothetical protein [Methylobacter sp.]|uniref:hypothetical protein n=1 Tax=Methylobacter sp. TaxID=2051955 RepID=UPI002FDCC4C7
MNLLTLSISAAILFLLSQKTKDGIRTPRKGHNRPLLNVVFLCPSKTQAALCRVSSVMVGCIEQPLKRLAGSFAGSANLIHSTAQRLAPMGGGYSSSQRNTVMNTPATNPANRGQNPLIAIFNIYHVRKLIASNVPGTRAVRYKEYNPALRVKFDRMGALS